uniref:Gag-Pol polyprotein n=1 Tax=Tanacetum cinerariifolium TaxID=118510 RepID=A0A699H7N1_TANCI|nr:Gag-Pol polyprotein [Tanacetum cinerariifolium]
MSKKQDCTAMSSVEAEYVALSARCAQVMWMRTQLQDYGFNYNKIPLYCDSQSAIGISCNPVQHSRTKHIRTRYLFIKEQVENGIIELYFVRTKYQLADMFTKALPEDRFKYLVRRIVLRYDGDEWDKGLMPTKIELTLEKSLQGVSNDVFVSIEGVEELKRNVWIKGENKAALRYTLGRNQDPIWGCDRLVSRANVIANQVEYLAHDFSVILISSDSSEESVGTSTTRGILFGTIPTTVPATAPTADLPIIHNDTPLIPTGQPIPIGRPYHTQPNGVLNMLTSRNRVGPLPTHRLALIYSGDYSSSDHFISDDSSPDSPSDSSLESSSDSHSDTSSYSSSRHSSAGHLISYSPCDTDCCFCDPSRKRRRSPTTLVFVASFVLGALFPVRADLSLPRKRIRYSYSETDFKVSLEEGYVPYVPREIGLGVDVEDSYEPYTKPDIDLDLQSDVMWCFFDSFHTLVEPKNFKEALLESHGSIQAFYCPKSSPKALSTPHYSQGKKAKIFSREQASAVNKEVIECQKKKKMKGIATYSPKGLIKGSGTKPEVPCEPKRKSKGSSKGAGIKPEVSDKPKDTCVAQDNDWGSDEEEIIISSDDEETESENEIAENEQTDDEYVHDDVEKHDDADEEMNNVENVVGFKDDQVMNDAEKTESKKTNKKKFDNDQAGVDHTVKDDQGGSIVHVTQKEKKELPHSTSILSMSSIVHVSFDVSLVGIIKEIADTEINSLVDVQIQQEIPHVLSALLLDVLPVFLAQSSFTPAQPASKANESIFKYELNKILFGKMDKSRSYMTHEKHYDLYNGLSNSIMLDEAIASGDVNHDKVLRKRDCGNDQDPIAGSDQGKKKRRKGKDIEPSKDKVQTDSSSKEPILDDVVNEVDQPQDDADAKQGKPDWFKQPLRPPTHDPEWNKDKKMLMMDQNNPSLMIWTGNSERKYTVSITKTKVARIVIQKRVEDVQLGVESYQDKLNITPPQKEFPRISGKDPYTTSYDLNGVVNLNLRKCKRLIRADQLYQFYDDKDLNQIDIMVNLIDKKLLEKWIMRSLEGLVCGRNVKTNYRLLQRIV